MGKPYEKSLHVCVVHVCVYKSVALPTRVHWSNLDQNF